MGPGVAEGSIWAPTDYILVQLIRFADLFDGRLARFGVREHVADATDEATRCLTDGNHYLWVYRDDLGDVGSMTQYFFGGPDAKILDAVEDAFDCTIYSEHQPQFWGFETFEDRDRAWEEAEVLQRGSLPMVEEIAVHLFDEHHEEWDRAWEDTDLLDDEFAMQNNDENPELDRPTLGRCR